MKGAASRVTLDIVEIGDVVWALDRECERITRTMRSMSEADRASVDVLLVRMKSLHDRLKSRYDSRYAALTGRTLEATNAR